MFNNFSPILFLFSGLLSWILTFILIPVLRRGFMDTPNRRSSHITATPRGGGLSFVIIGTLLTAIYEPAPSKWIPVICLPLALIGFIDDFKGLAKTFRYLVQVSTAIVLVIFSNQSLSLWLSLLCIFMLTAVINFTNFMDGLDGLVAGCGVLLLASTSSSAISGAILGFLIWNWAPAKVFMGDVGSTFIGAVFGGMILQTHNYHESFLLLLTGFPLFADAFICVIRRFINGDNILEAHRKHLFQRLHQANWSHKSVALLYVCAVAILLGSYSLAGVRALAITVAVEFLIGLYLDRYIAKDFISA